MNTIMAYHFTNDPRQGYVAVPYDKEHGVPLYDPDRGYGFVDKTCALPAREVRPSAIYANGAGFYIHEAFIEKKNGNEQHYNHYGMVFRVNAPPGAYEITVKLAPDSEEPWISISGMHAVQLLKEGAWDAAGKVAKRTVAKTEGRYWRYEYANGRNVIDIEIEPKHEHETIGIEEIVIKPMPKKIRPNGQLPAIFLLGDSTVKTYTFEEAPMSGWGQVIGNLFDPSKVQVVNYSMGGRSFRNAYAEGRFNDILITGNGGDYVFIQFGHNDEREDEYERFGRGSTEAMYETYIKEVYIPAIRARGMIPFLVTPMSRVNGAAQPGHIYMNSFKNRKFPDIMKRIGQELGVPVIDLNTASVEYYNEIGVEATTSVFMSIEAGETPGKTNDGSYANGHPANKNDGTHYKEALSKPFARIIATELTRLGAEGDAAANEVALYLRDKVKEAIAAKDWSLVYPEVTKDTTKGSQAYYRNQIEKLLQLGVFELDQQGRFHPERAMTIQAFIAALGKAISIHPAEIKGYGDGELTREAMAAILYDAYQARFEEKPRYMTDYNGNSNTPDSSQYDPNLDTGAHGVRYDPILPYDRLSDVDQLSSEFKIKVKAAYELGLVRSEKGIVRGKNMNGTELEPKAVVTRAKAAKAIYYMWILSHPVHQENQVV